MPDWEDWIKDKTICFYVAETVPSSSGSGINAFNFAKYLSKKAARVTILCYNYNKKLRMNEVIDKVNIRRVPYYNKNVLSKLISLPQLIFHYYKKTRANHLGFIYGRYLVGYEFILLFSFLFKKHTIFRSTLLGDDDIQSILKHSFPPFTKIRKYLFRKLTLYHAINEEFKKIWEMQYQQKIPVLLSSQGVDHKTFSPVPEQKKTELRKTFDIPTEQLVFLSSGILIERKGYRHIFESLSQLEIPFLYIIAGSITLNNHHHSSSQEQKEMKALLDLGKEKLGSKVLFLDNQTNMQAIYSMADIVIHGASKEGTPNTILEAMACKKPLVVKNLAGQDFLLKDKFNALLYAHEDELKNAILKLVNDSQLALKIANNGYQTILKDHAFEQVSKAILKDNEEAFQNIY